MFLTLLILGAIVLLVGYAVFVVDSFRVSLVWGLSVFLLPFAALVFLFAHWDAARRGFFIQIAALPLLLGAAIMMPKANAEPDAFAEMITAPAKRASVVTAEVARNAEMAEAASADPQPPATPPKITDLKQRYAELNAHRARLDTTDPAAVREFNREVAEYRSALERPRAP